MQLKRRQYPRRQPSRPNRNPPRRGIRMQPDPGGREEVAADVGALVCVERGGGEVQRFAAAHRVAH